MSINHSGISRRSFLGFAGIGALSLLAPIALAGCGAAASQGSGQPGAATTGQASLSVFRYGYTAASSDKDSGLTGLAISKGYFDEEFSKLGIQFTATPFVKAGPAINSALASGDLEVGGIGDTPAISAKAGGADTVAIAVTPSGYPVHIVVPTGSSYQGLEDLKGKKVAVANGTFLQIVFEKILADNNLTANDFQVVNMAEVDAATAVAAGSIDAAPVIAPKAGQLVGDGTGRSIYSTRGHDTESSTSVYVARSAIAKGSPDALVAFFRAIKRAEQDVSKEGTGLLRQTYIDGGLSDEVVDFAFPDDSYYVTTFKTDEKNLEILQDNAKFMKDKGLVKADVDVSSWFDGSFYDKAD